MTPRRVVAGVDVGNATTEVVLVDASTRPARPIAWDRAPTRGRKGSPAAAEGAGALVGRLSRRHGLSPALACIAPQRPVDTLTALVPRALPATGALTVLAAAAPTPGRPGRGTGRPLPVTAPPFAPDGPVVLLVPAAIGYAEAAERIRGWTAAGARVAAVLVEADEGVLVARRCGLDLPVLDGVPVARALGAELVAVEVAAPGRPLGVLSDPLRLRALADRIEPAAAMAVARSLADAGSAAVAVRVVVPGDGGSAGPGRKGALHTPDDDGAWVLDREGCRHGLAGAVAAVRAAAPGWARAVALPGREPARVEDLWVADLDAAAAEVEARRRTDLSHGLVVAGLAAHDEAAVAAAREALARVLGVPVVVVPGETAAARAGALSTPGAGPAAVVLDLGGGTVDAVAPGGTDVVVAGAGDMVTSAVAAVLGLPRGAADWVKRGPCARREGPHLLLGEDGSRTFSEAPAPAEAVGALVAPGPAGWLPFSRGLAPAEWRALRLHLKRVTLGENVARCLRLLAERAGPVREVVLVGGAAGDAEVLRVLDQAAPGALVGRADVAGALVPGSLGHRWAVAYGMTLQIDG